MFRLSEAGSPATELLCHRYFCFSVIWYKRGVKKWLRKRWLMDFRWDVFYDLRKTAKRESKSQRASGKNWGNEERSQRKADTLDTDLWSQIDELVGAVDLLDGEEIKAAYLHGIADFAKEMARQNYTDRANKSQHWKWRIYWQLQNIRNRATDFLFNESLACRVGIVNLHRLLDADIYQESKRTIPDICWILNEVSIGKNTQGLKWNNFQRFHTGALCRKKKINMPASNNTKRQSV